jgi:hypothetical protein
MPTHIAHLGKDELHPLSDEELRNVIKFEAEKAVDFSESELAQIRETSQNYFNGQSRVKAEPGRSKVVVTKTRDTVRQILPSIARIMMQTTAVVEFIPISSIDQAMVDEMNQVVNSVFWNNGGYELIVESATNTLNKRVGIIRCTYEEDTTAVHSIRDSMTRAEIDALELPDGYEITEETRIYDDDDLTATTETEDERTEDERTEDERIESLIYEDEGEGEEPEDLGDLEDDDPDAVYDIVITRKTTRRVWKFDTLPNEDFIIDKYARSFDDCQICGWRSNKRISDLVGMGFPYEDLIDCSFESGRFQGEKEARQGYTRDEEDSDEQAIDKSARMLLVNDLLIRVDADGDGYAELRHVITAGLDYKILLDEPANFINYARIRADIEPAAFFPQSINETTWQDTDAQTSLMRSILDNAHLVNSPRTVANPSYVNIEDLMNGEIGAIIRSSDVGQVNELVTPPTGAQNLQVLRYLDQVAEKRTGLVNAFQGTDPDVLQSTSRIGADAMIQGGQSMVEMIARNMSLGFADLFKIILKTIVMSDIKSIEVQGPDGKFREYDVRFWHDMVGTEVNVGIGTNQRDMRINALDKVAARQEQMLQMLGPYNPYVRYENLRRTYLEQLKYSGYKNGDAYFPPVDQNAEKAYYDEQARKAQEEGQDSTAAALIQAEKIKAQAKLQSDMVKTRAKTQIDVLKEQIKQGNDGAKLQLDAWMALLEDDLERDRMVQQLELEAARIEGEHEIQVDKLKIEQRQNEESYVNGQG